MDFSVGDIVTSAGGSALGAGGFVWYLIKSIFKRLDGIDTKLDRTDATIQKLAIKDAKDEGKFELIQSQIEANKTAIDTNSASNRKLWASVSVLGSKAGVPTNRISDLIEDSLK